MFYSNRLVPNVGFEDESPSSKSEGSPEEDRSCVGDPEGATTVAPGPVSPTPPPESIEPNRSPRHQNFNNGERRRRKLPEIPKNRKCKYLCPVYFMLVFYFPNRLPLASTDYPCLK